MNELAEEKVDMSEDLLSSGSKKTLNKSLEESIEDVLEKVSINTNYFIGKSLSKAQSTSDYDSDSDDLDFDERTQEEEVNLETCSVRCYIENTVAQTLLSALTILERERPENPIKWLAAYLLFHKDDLPEFKKERFSQREGVEMIKLPEHIWKAIMNDTEDLNIIATNELI